MAKGLGGAIGGAIGDALADSIHGEMYLAILAFFVLDAFLVLIFISLFLFSLNKIKKLSIDTEYICMMYFCCSLVSVIVSTITAVFDFKPLLVAMSAGISHLIISLLMIKYVSPDGVIPKIKYMIVLFILWNPFIHIYIYAD